MNFLKLLRIKTSYDENLWCIWYFLAIIVFIGTTLMFITSHTKKVNIILTENKKIDITLFSFTTHNAGMRLIFKDKYKQDRPELGNFNPNTGSYKTGKLEFENPGEPVKILISDDEQKVIYEAMPLSGRGVDFNERDLIVFVKDNNSFVFSFGKSKSIKRFSIKPGFNKFQITVLQVGNKIKNEKVLLYIDPPLGFKHTDIHPLYFFLWFFFFWPFYVLILLIFYIIIAIRKIRYLHKHPELKPS